MDMVIIYHVIKIIHDISFPSNVDKTTIIPTDPIHYT